MLQEIGLEGRKTGDRRTGLAERSQAGIDPVNETVRGYFLEECDDLARLPGEIFMRTQRPRTVRFALLAVKEHEIHIG